MRPKSLLILTAVMTEAKAIAKALQMACPKPGNPSEKRRGDLHVTLAVIGVSAKTLPDRAGDLVVMAGLAGALDASLAIADLVADDWADGLEIPSGVRGGKMLCTQRIASTASEKSALFEDTRCAAVEMENQIVREWAKSHGAQFCAIRSISDRADQPLDPALLTMIDPWGRPKLLPLLRLIVLRPSVILNLMRVGANSTKAARRLGEAVRDLVESVVATDYPNQSQSSNCSRPSG